VGTGAVQEWDATTGNKIGEPLQHEETVLAAHFSPDGKRIFTVGEGGLEQELDATTGKETGELHQLGYGSIKIARFSPDGTKIVTSSGNDTTRVWDTATGKEIMHIWNEGEVKRAQFSRNGAEVITKSEDGTARVWDLTKKREIGEPLQDVGTAELSPDGTKIVATSGDYTARVSDIASGKEIGEPLRHDDQVMDAQFSPDGTMILTASWDHTARLWDVPTGKEIGEPLRLDDKVWEAQFSPDGAKIVTASDDKTARVWDISVFRSMDTPVPEDAQAWALALAGIRFDKDGRECGIPTAQRVQILRAGISGTNPWAGLARWVNDTSDQRTIDPLSKITCREIAERGINEGTKEGLISAILYDSTAPLERLLIARYEEKPASASFLQQYELRHLPPDGALWARAAIILLDQQAPQLALEAARKAVRLGPDLPGAKVALDAAMKANGLK